MIKKKHITFLRSKFRLPPLCPAFPGCRSAFTKGCFYKGSLMPTVAKHPPYVDNHPQSHSPPPLPPVIGQHVFASAIHFSSPVRVSRSARRHAHSPSLSDEEAAASYIPPQGRNTPCCCLDLGDVHTKLCSNPLLHYSSLFVKPCLHGGERKPH